MAEWAVLDSDFYSGPPGKGGAVPYSTGYIQKAIYAGPLLDVEWYPKWDTRPPDGVRAKRLRATRAAQVHLNEKNARKRFARLLNCNFGPDDYYVTFTYRDTDGPLPDIAQARRDVQNYIRRWQRARKRAGLGKGRYMYVVEGAEEGEKRTRIHVHVVLQGGLSRDDVENLWPYGLVNAKGSNPTKTALRAWGNTLPKTPRVKSAGARPRGLKSRLYA